MKVLKPGKPRFEWDRNLVCTGDGHGDRGCGAVLLVDASDLYKVTYTSGIFVTFACIECGAETVVNEDLVDKIPVPLKASWMKQRVHRSVVR